MFKVGTDDLSLEAPLILVGKSSVSLLDDATTLAFTNDDPEKEAVIDMSGDAPSLGRRGGGGCA